VDVAIHRENGVPYDYHRQLYKLRVHSGRKDVGIYRPEHTWTCAGALQVSGFK
jgi:hypothetical protein